MMSPEIGEIAAALAAAQAEMQTAKKDSANPFFKSKYADLAAVREACQGALSKYGLAVSQLLRVAEDGKTYLDTLLAHKSGQWLKSTYPIRPVKDDPQGLGSAITYARRYALSAITGVATEDDDDGNAATYGQSQPKKSFDDLPAKKSPKAEKTALKEMDAPPPEKLLQLPTDLTTFYTPFQQYEGVTFAKMPDKALEHVGQHVSQMGHKETVDVRKAWYSAIADALIYELERRKDVA